MVRRSSTGWKFSLKWPLSFTTRTTAISVKPNLKSTCGKPKRWKRSDAWQEASPTTSTTFSPQSAATDLILPHVDEDDSIVGDLNEIRRVAGSAAVLIRQLLTFSRREPLLVTAVELNVVISNTTQLLQRALGEDISIITELSLAVRAVKADVTQVQQVLMNLAVNARDAMPTGGTLTIETAFVDLADASIATHPGVRPGRYIQMTVSDTGHGMDATTKERIFEPFFRPRNVLRARGLDWPPCTASSTRRGE